MYHFCFCFIVSVVLAGCSSSVAPEEEPVSVNLTTVPGICSYQVFENIDSAGTMHGFGYDVYVGEKRMIHQVNIPGETGHEGFVSREEAERVGQLVVRKMDGNAGFPTVSRAELDSMGVTFHVR